MMQLLKNGTYINYVLLKCICMFSFFKLYKSGFSEYIKEAKIKKPPYLSTLFIKHFS